MPYYHVRLYLYTQRQPPKIAHSDLLNLRKTYVVKEIADPYLRGERFQFGNLEFDPSQVAELEIRETSDTVGSLFYDFQSGTNVTDMFIRREGKEEATPRKTASNRDVFIVHGRTHGPMKELKTMLYEFGLNPIVLHEQPSGSRTIVEKLEKYSDVGYVFVILTPDDIGAFSETFDRIKDLPLLVPSTGNLLGQFGKRARQNVILEFGYFMGLLGRDRVCCLHQGDVELPTDMHGIVYIPFKDSVEEVRLRVMKELKAAGYEIKV